MIPDDLERILAAGDAIQPSPAFTRNVMAEVHREAGEPPRLPFPWIRFCMGAGASGIAAAAATVYLTASGFTGNAFLLLTAGSPVPELACTFAVALIGFGIAAIPRVLWRP